MHSIGLRSAFLGLCCATAVSFAWPVQAEMVNLKAAMNASSEVPPTSSSGSGTLTATYDTATAAHFHLGDPGKNGGVVVPISPAASPFEGSATLTDAQAAEVLDGKWYVNVHTEANKGGEIRGQVTK